jgi:homoserine trans-succinylase
VSPVVKDSVLALRTVLLAGTAIQKQENVRENFVMILLNVVPDMIVSTALVSLLIAAPLRILLHFVRNGGVNTHIAI